MMDAVQALASSLLLVPYAERPLAYVIRKRLVLEAMELVLLIRQSQMAPTAVIALSSCSVPVGNVPAEICNARL